MPRIAVFPLLVLLAGCGSGSKKLTSAPACPATAVPAVLFYPARLSPSPEEEARLPKAYTAYRVSADEWRAFAAKVKERGPGERTGLALPMKHGCTAFSTTVSSTMSPELAAKYPALASLQGEASDGAKLRLEWDGSKARAQVLHGSEAWYLEPFDVAGDVFYLLYNKADAPGRKTGFEEDLRRPAPDGTNRGTLERRVRPNTNTE